MDPVQPVKKISESPTNPKKTSVKKEFDVADLYQSPEDSASAESRTKSGFAEKPRQAYFWIVNQALISTFYDVEYDDGPNHVITFGDSKSKAVFPSGQSYSSFNLLPLLNLTARRR